MIVDALLIGLALLALVVGWLLVRGGQSGRWSAPAWWLAVIQVTQAREAALEAEIQRLRALLKQRSDKPHA